MYALNLDKETKRCLSVTYLEYAAPDAVFVKELPEGNLPDYLYIGGNYIYEPLPTPEPSAEQQIAELKAELSATDYKIIKCSEAQLVGEELPYDIVALHAERQAIRDRINELESGEING